MALTLEDVDKIIDKAKPDLLKRLDISLLLRSKLIRDGVITRALKDQLEVDKLSRHEKISKLIDSIKTGPVERFLTFCRTLHTEGQGHLLDIMGVDLNQIDAQLAVLEDGSGCSGIHSRQDLSLPAPLTDRPTQKATTMQTQQGLRGPNFPRQKEYYRTKLAKSPIYEYIIRSPSVHIDTVYTNLQLVDNQDDRVVITDPSNRKNLRPISTNEMFKHDEERLSILIEGKPGAGKSTLMRHSAVDWAKRHNPHDGQGQHSDRIETSPLHDMDLVIYIDKHDEGKTLNETIWNALKGTEQDKEEATCFRKERPESTFLFVDALDEFLNEKVRAEILKMVEDCSVNILVSCRLGHPYIEGKTQYFNRHVLVEGFDNHNAEAFVQKYMKALCGSSDDTELSQKCERLSRALRGAHTQNVYICPMNCAVLCTLYHSGGITDDELCSLTIRQLYEKQQDLLLKRELIKMAKLEKDQRDRIERDIHTTRDGIHRMALDSLLKGKEKQSSYSEEQLEAFGINVGSPAMVLLQVSHELSPSHGPTKMYSWPHQTIKEFHAACAVKDPTLIYLIASKPELNEVTKFIVSAFLDTDPQVAKDLLTAVLLLQSTDPPCTTSEERYGSFRGVPCHACSEISKLKKKLAKQEVDMFHQEETLEHKMLDVSDAFAQICNCVRGSDWMIKNKMIFLLEDIVKDTEQGSQILADVVHPTLPSISHGQEWRSTSYDERPLMAILPWKGRMPWLHLCINGSNTQLMKRTLFTMLSDVSLPWAISLAIVRGLDLGCSDRVKNASLPIFVCITLAISAYRLAQDVIWFCFSRKQIAWKQPLHSNQYYEVISPEVPTIVAQFAKKCGKVGNIEIYTHLHAASSGNYIDEEKSTIWRDTIIEINTIFKPTEGIKTHPGFDKIMTAQDIGELKSAAVRSPSYCCKYLLLLTLLVYLFLVPQGGHQLLLLFLVICSTNVVMWIVESVVITYIVPLCNSLAEHLQQD